MEGHRADATAAGLAARLVIAARLFISQVTVRTHVSAILRELHVSTREAAIELLGVEEAQRQTGRAAHAAPPGLSHTRSGCSVPDGSRSSLVPRFGPGARPRSEGTQSEARVPQGARVFGSPHSVQSYERKIGLQALVRAEQRGNTGCPGTAAARLCGNTRESNNQLLGELQPDRRLVTRLTCRSTI